MSESVVPSEVDPTAARASGFRVHLGWADAVTLESVDGVVSVVDRRRVELQPPSGPVFPYHQARDAPNDERDWIIASGTAAAEAAAIDVLVDLSGELGLHAVGVVVSRGLSRMPLDDVFASERLFHAAEAAVFQRALRAAAAILRIPCSTVAFTGAEDDEHWATVSRLGRSIGPPWRRDQKLAALAAHRALTSSA